MSDNGHDAEPSTRGTNHFSDLLWISHNHHKISKVWENDNQAITTRHHIPFIPYHQSCESALLALGFYQLVELRKLLVDRFLIGALVERWRPETHTFHMPWGEMTVTLEDVNCLWGMNIRGDLITSKSDGNWTDHIERLLGIPPEEQGMKEKKRKVEGGAEEPRVTYSNYAISLKKLRSRFQKLDDDAPPEQVDYYTRAFVLDLLGSIVFPDSSGDRVPAMFLQFLENLDQPKEYNWGAATLAFLYRQLCLATERDRSEIGGALPLLQIWFWSHIPIGRPLDKSNPLPIWGQPNLDSCPTFGARWVGREMIILPRNAGVEYYRNFLEKLDFNEVVWQPYQDVMHLMPYRVQEQRALWYGRVPLIYFWIVEYHYPDRVMRQFGLKQQVSPPLPHSRIDQTKMHKAKHVGKPCDWSIAHATWIKEYRGYGASIIVEEEPFDVTKLSEYRRWYQRDCMYSIYLDSSTCGMRDPLPLPRDDTDWTGFVPSGPPVARMALRSIKQAAWGVKLAVTKGRNKVGKLLVKKTCHGNLRDVQMEAKLKYYLKEAGLPTIIDDIVSEESTPAQSTPMPPPPNETTLEAMDDWLYSDRGFTRYFGLGVPTSSSGPSSVTEQAFVACSSNPGLVMQQVGSSHSHNLSSMNPQEGTSLSQDQMPWNWQVPSVPTDFSFSFDFNGITMDSVPCGSSYTSLLGSIEETITQETVPHENRRGNSVAGTGTDNMLQAETTQETITQNLVVETGTENILQAATTQETITGNSVAGTGTENMLQAETTQQTITQGSVDLNSPPPKLPVKIRYSRRVKKKKIKYTPSLYK